MLSVNNETLIDTLDEFESFMAQSKPGDRCCYYRGFLWADRSKFSDLSEADRDQLDRLADRVWFWKDANRVRLTQRREGEHCAYLATVRPRRFNPADLFRSEQRREKVFETDV